MDCCDVNGLRGMFRGPLVGREVRAFEKHGLNRRQRQLVAAAGPAMQASLLEIGCGIAAPSLSLLQAGAASAELVDVSPDYLEAARQLAQELGLAARIRTHLGDFALLPEPEQADIVLLDRVVCCYPDAQALLEKAAHCSRHRLVVTYPKTVWWMRLVRQLINASMRLLGRDYRFFLHAPSALHEAAMNAGHQLVASSSIGPWQLAVFERNEIIPAA